jgi:hypothetical protein
MTNGESTVLFGSADNVTGMYSEERPELWPNKWILYHDNAPVHYALTVREFLSNKFITKMDQLPYPPDLAPCVFSLSKIKKCPEGTKIF